MKLKLFQKVKSIKTNKQTPKAERENPKKKQTGSRSSSKDLHWDLVGAGVVAALQMVENSLGWPGPELVYGWHASRRHLVRVQMGKKTWLVFSSRKQPCGYRWWSLIGRPREEVRASGAAQWLCDVRTEVCGICVRCFLTHWWGAGRPRHMDGFLEEDKASGTGHWMVSTKAGVYSVSTEVSRQELGLQIHKGTACSECTLYSSRRKSQERHT